MGICYEYPIIISSSLGYRASLDVSPHISGICYSNNLITNTLHLLLNHINTIS